MSKVKLMKGSLRKLFLATCFLTGLACSQKDADKVADAQKCLDRATSATAYSCSEKVAGVETEAGYLIRCSAHVVYQDLLTPTRLASIAEQLKNSSSASSSSTVAMGLLAFSKTKGSDSASTLAAQAASDCLKSGSKGMILLTSMAQIATAIVATGIGSIITNCDPTSPSYNASTCQSSMQSAVCNADPAVLGAAAQSALQQSCQTGGSQTDSSVCAQFNTVSQGANGSAAAIGENLKDQIKGSGGCP